MYQKQIEEYFRIHREELLRDIAELIRVPSEKGEPKPGMPFGEAPAKALDTAEKLAKTMGFSVRGLRPLCHCGRPERPPKAA